MKTRQSTRFTITTLTLCVAAIMLVPNSIAADKTSMVNSTDETFIKQAAADGKGEVKVAGLAVKKADSAAVRAFAEMIVKDHTAANEELTKLAASKGVELSAVIAPSNASTFQKLEKYSGADFDKEFLATMVSDHKKCVSSFETEAKDAKDGDLKAWAEKMLPALKTHLEKANELSSK